jgi:hypothetical protein
MNRNSLNAAIFALVFLVSGAKSFELSNQQSFIEEKEPTMLDRWNEARRQAAIAVGTVKDPSSARQVRRHAKPEIIVKYSNIFFDGKLLELGRPLTFWKNILRGKPRCDKTGKEWCVWEELGLEVSTSEKNNFGVKSINIKINIIESVNNELKISYPERTHDNNPKTEWLAYHPFTGYLEIDGFGIDKETKFWELESNVDSRRNLSCGLRSCEFPRGVLGPNKMIALHLNGSNESSEIEDITFYITSY